MDPDAYANIPERYASLIIDLKRLDNELRPDGQAKYVPNGLRVVESILLREFSVEDLAVCYPEQLEVFVGEDSHAVGIHAHNPVGITFATDVYAQLVGPTVEPLNAAEFKRLIFHPALRRYKSRLKIIVGGLSAWQIEKMGLQDEWDIDCLVDGEAEQLISPLFPHFRLDHLLITS